jgi:hypothetical protein
MATIDHGTIYVARQSFVVWDGGRMLRFRRGRTTIRAGHHLIEGREKSFAPLEVTYELEPAPSPAASSSSTKKAPPPGAAERAALVARAKALGIPAKGKSVDLEAAIAAIETADTGGSDEPRDTEPGADVTG